MNRLTATLSSFDRVCERLDGLVQRNVSAILLGCMLSAALVVWLVPAPPETRCMLVRNQALAVKAAISLSITLTALAWHFHKPALRWAASLRAKESATLPE